MSIKEICLLTLIILSFTSCIQTGVISFTGRKSTLSAETNIKKFMTDNPEPSIILRLPKHVQEATEGDPYHYLYNAIENELAMAGFKVKDRGLANQILNHSEANSYLEIQTEIQTDLILELTKMDLEVIHTTNKFLTKSGEEKASKQGQVTKMGGAFEFKLVLVKNNSHGGNYAFYYTPCKDKQDQEECACKIKYARFPVGYKIYTKKDVCAEEIADRKGPFEDIEEDIIEDVVRRGIKDLIKDIK